MSSSFAGLAAYLLSSISLRAMLGPKAGLPRLVDSNGVASRAKCPITFDGVPLQVVLARLNAKRGLPNAGRRALKEGPRAKAKALSRQRAAESHQEQKAYEKAFWRMKQWSWRRVEKELHCRHLSWAAISVLAAEVGVKIALAGDTFMQAAA
jgi:hypothetical protein